MARIVWTAEAERWLLKIHDYIAADSPVNAFNVVQTIYTRAQIKALRRQARQALTLQEQHEIQQQLQKLEKQQRRQRQDIFPAEDEIMEKRDALIESLERRLAQNTAAEPLFTIRWVVT